MAFGTVKVDALESAVKTVQVGQIVAVSGVASGESPVWNGTTWEGDVIEGETNLSYVTATRTLNSSTGSGVILPLVTTSGDGLSSATDKAKLNGIASGATANIGTVTSIELTAPSGLVVSGGPITGSGTLTLAYASGFQAFTESESTKLAGVASGAEVNVNADWNAGSGDAQILNKPTLGTAAATNSTDYAPAAQGVTNGNSHDHNGGDGAQIAYGSLSGLPSIPPPADAAPQPLAATAAIGSSTDYAREDHVHALPAVATTSAAGLAPATSFAALTYASTTDLDMAALDGQYRTITLTGDLTFTTSNRATGRTAVLRLLPGAAVRTLTFPAGWVFVGIKPATLAASKAAVLSLTFFGTADTDCIAAYSAQQ